MQKCLGIYIETNIIKYAKVSKEHEDVKIESFGVRFFDTNLSAEISKIIEETFSFNTPISVNISNEKYLYFDVFALLKKKDIESTIATEFETYCEENKYNKNAFETRFALMEDVRQDEKVRAMDVYINKIELNRQTQPLEKVKLTKIVPTPIAITNVGKVNTKENQLIVNMEESTMITTIINQNIYEVETMDVGSKEVLDSINVVENSYAKAYEICKNTTIYTAEMDTRGENEEFLQYIIPTIYKVAQRVQELVSESWRDIKKVYLTGTLAIINNIDLYFQEFLPDIECEILKPKMVKGSAKNVKEYIEVNSAIGLAMTGIGEGIQEFNFQKTNSMEKFKRLLKSDIGSKNTANNDKKDKKFNLDFDLKGDLSKSERWLVRGIATVVLILIIYTVFSILLSKSMIDKKDEIDGLISTQNSQISAVNSDKTSIDTKTKKYSSLISDLDEIDKRTSDIAASRNLIPNLLNQIMFVIPEKVELSSIENTTGKSVRIQASSEDYEQLGYFIATLKTKGILNNVVSSSGNKTDNSINVTIEGELP